MVQTHEGGMGQQNAYVCVQVGLHKGKTVRNVMCPYYFHGTEGLQEIISSQTHFQSPY